MNIDSYLAAFGVWNPKPLANSPRCNLWYVDTHNGPAVLKVLTDRGLKAGEMTGAQALNLWGGRLCCTTAWIV